MELFTWGVEDSNSQETEGCTYGEKTGIPVQEKRICVDALRSIERCVPTDGEDVHQCVRPPRPVEVLDLNITEKTW